MKKVLILIILLCALVTGCGEKSDEGMVKVEYITVNEVKKVIDNYDNNKDYVIIDVRTSGEYVSGHLKGAINIPVDQIGNIDISKDKKIIVYCRSGSRSNNAAIQLINLGYNKVYDMGGIINWNYDLVEED